MNRFRTISHNFQRLLLGSKLEAVGRNFNFNTACCSCSCNNIRFGHTYPTISIAKNNLIVNKMLCSAAESKSGLNLTPSRTFLKSERCDLVSFTGSFRRGIRTFTEPLQKKSKSSAKNEDEEDEDKERDDEEIEVMGKGDKVLKLRLQSDRLDAVLKACLQMSRNKIEKTFYADRIRVNGERPKKKSQLVGEGDEVDVIRRYNAKNPDYLDVSRLEILEMGGYSRTEDEDSDDEAKIPAKVKRSKNLTIENYQAPFKGNVDDS